MSSSTPVQTAAVPTVRQHLIDACEREHAKTVRVLRAYPSDKWELRPHAMCKNAKELAWMFVLELGAMQRILTTGLDFSKPPSFPPPPETAAELLAAFEDAHAKTGQLLRALRDEDMARGVQFFTGPGKVGEVPLLDVLWTMTCDQIHHRGQFSIYLRMADGKVPSIYGPTADEPWM